MPKVNAYSLFVYDVARRRKASGEGNCQVPHLFKELGSEWSSLSDAEKQKYKDRAKSSTSGSSVDRWKQSRETPVDQLARARAASSSSNTHQPSVSSVKMEADLKPDLKPDIKKRPHDDTFSINDQEKKKLKPGIPNWKNLKHTNMDDPIKYLDKHLYDMREQCQSILRARSDKIFTIPIYTFSANVLCKQKKDTEDIFVPLEVCICAYSLRNGNMGQPYHVMINAGPVPSNCVTAAMDHSSNHKITFPNNLMNTYPPEARKDYKKIYKEMLNYTKEGERTILVRTARDLAQVRGTLEWLYNKGMEEPGTKLAKVSTWTILPITEFVASMYNFVYQDMCRQGPRIGIYYYINMYLDGCAFDYNTAIMCEYHKKPDYETKWCAQACAKKMIMTIEDSILREICNMYEFYKNSQMVQPVLVTHMNID